MALSCWFPRISAVLLWLSIPLSLYIGTIGLLPFAGGLVCVVVTATTTILFLSLDIGILLAAAILIAFNWPMAWSIVFWTGALILAIAVALGLVIRAVLRSSKERRHQDALITQVREQAERARREERLRLAHEMHDYVAHELTVSVAALAAARSEPGADERRSRSDSRMLQTVETSNRRALDELRHALRVLDDDAVRPVGSAVQPPATASKPTLTSLVEAAAQDLAVVGDRVRVSTPTDGAPEDDDLLDLLRRFLTEGVTNVVKYGGRGADVAIEAGIDDDTLTVTIDNTIAARPAGQSTGLGLPGLSAEARQRGGRISSGPRPQGSGRPGNVWRLELVVPLGADCARTPTAPDRTGDSERRQTSARSRPWR